MCIIVEHFSLFHLVIQHRSQFYGRYIKMEICTMDSAISLMSFELNIKKSL